MIGMDQTSVAFPPHVSETREIVRAAMRKFLVDSSEFFSISREQHIVAARREVALRLKDRGYSLARIGRILARHRSTVKVYLSDDMRSAKQARYIAKSGRVVRIKPQYFEGLQRLAELTGTSIEAIVNQAVSDTLEAS
ncbi:helix-turn-helix domain-containing protein [Bradyrhizobium elkanii]|uniref:helix-turn-helix domain-containing protein n=1 Tax=Bradyrhizobium elkanii TaxID=29448 RepID=UPI0021697A57|nr:helix-turn-helix domain-containing protein [Bradyrhizobium elkanii]MCS3690921.1 putative transcriptional regulator [Bradyrhizobium elkanii]